MLYFKLIAGIYLIIDSCFYIYLLSDISLIFLVDFACFDLLMNYDLIPKKNNLDVVIDGSAILYNLYWLPYFNRCHLYSLKYFPNYPFIEIFFFH